MLGGWAYGAIYGKPRTHRRPCRLARTYNLADHTAPSPQAARARLRELNNLPGTYN